MTIFFVVKVTLAQQKSQFKVLQINIWQEGKIVPNGFPAITDEIIVKKAVWYCLVRLEIRIKQILYTSLDRIRK